MLFFYLIVWCCILPEFYAYEQRIDRDQAERMARPLAGQTQAMSGMDRHSELQQHKTAAEYRQAADEHARTLKDFWKDFLVSGLFVLAAIVAIFACLAWFAANNRVSATGSTIGAKGPRFVLSGTQGGTAGKYDAQDNYASDSTSLAVNNLFNLNNMSADGSLSPGSAGQLQLNVKPLCNDLHDITVEMTWEISVQTSVAGTDSVVDASTNEEIINSLKDLVRGHILVFQGKDTSGFYSNPLVPTTTTVTQDGASVTVITQSFTIPARSFCAEGSNSTTKTATKTLYWIWPEQFKSYVRTGNAGYGGNLFANTGDEGGYTTLVGDINNNHACYFRADSTSVPGQAPSAVPPVGAGMSSADVETCANYYNNADEIIGKNVKYIRVRFTAKEADK